MYAMLSSEILSPQYNVDYTSTSENNFYTDLAAMVISLVSQVRENQAVKRQLNKVSLYGESGDLRQCFLDMDSGDVVFY
jgi:hypothetical protein